ncbi:hypothetical protein AAVH_11947 [Aphelenchoides avenae]|nr:hypothetical protein AAVH_11947 [Aphelenchus avenae]
MAPSNHHQVGPNAARWPVREASSRPGLYEVECIAGCRINYGAIDYLVKYERYRVLEWTPSDNLDRSRDAIDRFKTAMRWKAHKRMNGTWYLPDELWSFDEEAIESGITEDSGSGSQSIAILFSEYVAVTREHLHEYPSFDDVDLSAIRCFDLDGKDSNTTLIAGSRDKSDVCAMPASAHPMPAPQNPLETIEVECDQSAVWDDSWDFPLYHAGERNGDMRRQPRSTLSSCCKEAIEHVFVENQRPTASNQHLWVTELEELTGQLGKMAATDKP